MKFQPNPALTTSMPCRKKKKKKGGKRNKGDLQSPTFSLGKQFVKMEQRYRSLHKTTVQKISTLYTGL